MPDLISHFKNLGADILPPEKFDPRLHMAEVLTQIGAYLMDTPEGQACIVGIHPLEDVSALQSIQFTTARANMPLATNREIELSVLEDDKGNLCIDATWWRNRELASYQRLALLPKTSRKPMTGRQIANLQKVATRLLRQMVRPSLLIKLMTNHLPALG